ncbi:Hpt domain-containing protein [Algoriphagus resistens]|uniref:Hpt domain-containing protein n=1 Tax=Algoriphagus resistens TaxID=1750590 RepID=UPI0007167E9C|nr:Hpt domain-containing protein [Algoriphagus resistens]
MYQSISEQSIYQYFGEDEPEMVREMVQIILETNIKDLKELDTFYKQGDFGTIKNRCHKAKPTMVYIGAKKARKILEELENNRLDFPELNASLQAQLTEIETELNQFLETLD